MAILERTGGDSGKSSGVYSRVEREAGVLSVDETLIGWEAEPLAFGVLKAGAKDSWGGVSALKV